MPGDLATDIGNMHKNLVRIARVVPEIFSRTDRQTDADRHTHHKTGKLTNKQTSEQIEKSV